jgi:hypothetical protein
VDKSGNGGINTVVVAVSSPMERASMARSLVADPWPDLGGTPMFHPQTKREADWLAFKLFTVMAFTMVGLITLGIL